MQRPLEKPKIFVEDNNEYYTFIPNYNLFGRSTDSSFPYKLRLNILEDDYFKNREKITQILCRLRDKYETTNQPILREFKSFLLDRKKVDAFDNHQSKAFWEARKNEKQGSSLKRLVFGSKAKAIAKTMVDESKKSRYLKEYLNMDISDEEIQGRMAEQDKVLTSNYRLIGQAQFTLHLADIQYNSEYLKGFDSSPPQQIDRMEHPTRLLCFVRELDLELRRAGIRSGGLADTDSPITSFVSFRQQELSSVEGYISHFADKEKLSTLKEAQENSVLYKFLKININYPKEYEEVWSKFSDADERERIIHLLENERSNKEIDAILLEIKQKNSSTEDILKELDNCMETISVDKSEKLMEHPLFSLSAFISQKYYETRNWAPNVTNQTLDEKKRKDSYSIEREDSELSASESQILLAPPLPLNEEPPMEEILITPKNTDVDPLLDEKKSEKSYVPYHSGLSSLAQAQDDYTKVFSDHVPILATIPLQGETVADDSKDTKDRRSITVLSWNVLQFDSANGFAPLDKLEYLETDEQRVARHQRIAEGLEKMVQENHPQFITLQEIRADKGKDDLYKEIQKILGENYQPIRFKGDVVDRGDCITFYDTTQFKPVIDADIKNIRDFSHAGLEGNTTVFENTKVEALRVRLLNVHAPFTHVPDRHEGHINQFLGVKDPNTVSMVVGDFNCHIAPLPDSKPQNITTSAATHRFRHNQLQGAAAIDGCFASTNAQKFQVDTVHLDPSNGKAYEASALQPIDTDSLPELQKKEIADYHMMVAVDDYYLVTPMIGEHNIFQYQQRLRQQFRNDSILVRPASNLNNHQKIGLFLSKELCHCIQLVDPQKFQFQLDQNIFREFIYYIYVDRIHTDELLELTDKIATNTNLVRLSAKILTLKENANIDRNIVARFDALLKTLISEPLVLNRSFASTIIDHFIQEAEAIARNPNRSIDEIKRSAAELDARLYGKPPMGKQLKSAICLLIATCSGAAVGVTFSALASMDWDGGFAAFAESFADKFEISDPGLIAGALLVGALGAAVGFFSAKRNEKQYAIKERVVESAREVNAAIAPKTS